MKRRTFDILVSITGLFLAVTLAVAGGLALWGHNFIGNQVHNQLAAQKIYFPPASAFAHPKAGTEITPSMIPSVSQYAGQQMLTGQQAEVWANDFIAVHLVEIGGGKTYAQLSTEAIAQPANQKLAAEKIFFPANNSPAIKAPEFAAMHQYAGQQLTTGAQAEVWADHFIANHLKVIGGGKTYAQLSAEAIAQPTNLKLAAQVNTVFKGETLRGLLLNAYAFGTMGTIAGIAAIAAFIAAAVMLILGGLGLAHARQVTPGTEILTGHPGHTRAVDATLVPAAHASHNGHAVAVPDSAAPTA